MSRCGCTAEEHAATVRRMADRNLTEGERAEIERKAHARALFTRTLIRALEKDLRETQL
jgi:hypothetical protein